MFNVYVCAWVGGCVGGWVGRGGMGGGDLMPPSPVICTRLEAHRLHLLSGFIS